MSTAYRGSTFESVPAYESYNHHYTAAIYGAGAVARPVENWDPMTHTPPVEFLARAGFESRMAVDSRRDSHQLFGSTCR